MWGGNQTGGAYHHCAAAWHSVQRVHVYIYTPPPRAPRPSSPPPLPPPFYAALKVSCRANIVGRVAIGIIALKSKMVSRYTLFVIKILRIYVQKLFRGLYERRRGPASGAARNTRRFIHRGNGGGGGGGSGRVICGHFCCYLCINMCARVVFLKGFRGGFLKGCQ